MTILIATDLSDNSRNALQFGAALAAAREESVTVLRAVELSARDMSQILDSFDAENAKLQPSEEAREQTKAFVQGAVDEVADVVTTVGYPAADNIVRHARQLDASMIVVGMTGTSRIGEAFFGSTASSLVRQADRPVLVVSPDAEFAAPRSILVPVDLSPISESTLAYAGELARRVGGRLLVGHAVPLPTASLMPAAGFVPPSPEIAHAARERVSALVESLALSDIAEVRLHEGGAAPYIKEMAKDADVNLIVMSSHTRRGVERLFLGSTTEKVLRNPPCPVLVVPAPKE